MTRFRIPDLAVLPSSTQIADAHEAAGGAASFDRDRRICLHRHDYTRHLMAAVRPPPAAGQGRRISERAHAGRPRTGGAERRRGLRKLLISSVPELRIGWLEETMETQEAQAGIDRVVKLVEVGCPFFDRCPLAIEGACDKETPPIRNLGDGHAIECHRSEAEFLGAS